MVCRLFTLGVLYLHRLLLGTCDNLDKCLADIVSTDKRLVASCRQKCRLVKQIGNVSACEARGGFCNFLKVNTFLKLLVAAVYLENFLTTLDVGIVYRYLSVKATGAQKRGVKNIGAVCCRDNNDALVRAEAVHLNKELVKGLLAFVVSTAETCTSVTSDRVDFVYKDN